MIDLERPGGLAQRAAFLGEALGPDELELKDLGGMIKIEQTQWTHQAMRAIGSGFQSVLFADVRTVADAVTCIRAVRAEEPRAGGLHGVGMRRDVGTLREAGQPVLIGGSMGTSSWILAGTDTSAILSLSAKADAFNNSGDAIALGVPTGNGTPKYPWDDPTDPND